VAAGRRAAGVAVEEHPNARKKVAALPGPAVLAMRGDAGHFTGVAANTVCRIGNNKFIHLLPFIIPGLTGKQCNNQALLFRVFIWCLFLRAVSKNRPTPA
jgi:hypothetical protein